MGVSVSFSAKESSYSVANNTSTIKCTLTVTTSGSSYNNYGMVFTINIGGKSSSSTIPVGYNTSKSYSWSRTITHADDGSLSVSCKGTVATDISAGTVTKSTSLSTSNGTLTKIPRASTITSASNITLGEACDIKWTPLSSGFNYELKFSLGEWNETISSIKPNTTSAYTYDDYIIPIEDLLSEIPKATGTMEVVLTTYNGTTPIGSISSKEFTVTVPDSYTNSNGETVSLKPKIGSISSSFTSFNHKMGSRNDLLVKSKNGVKIVVSNTTKATGASIVSYTFSGQNLNKKVETTSLSASATSDTITVANDNLSYKVVVTDSRGKTDEKKISNIKCYDYSAPSISSFQAFRCDDNGNPYNDGKNIKFSYTANYSSIVLNGTETNGADVNIYYKLSSDDTIAIENVESYPDQIIPIDNNINTFQVWTGINDYYFGAGTSDTSFIKSEPVIILPPSRIMNARKDGKGIAFGQKSENEGFECRWDARFYGDIDGANASFSGTIDADALSEALFAKIYPVGSIYMSMESTNPSTLFGGTWKRIAQGRMLLGVGGGKDETNNDDNFAASTQTTHTYKIGETGGAAYHELTVDEMPNHRHSLVGRTWGWGISNATEYTNASAYTGNSSQNVLESTPSYSDTLYSGGGETHNNMPPYLAVYMWQRTA